jgi:hypothetical protein
MRWWSTRIGLRDDSWTDWQGSVVTEAAKVRDGDSADRRRSDGLHEAFIVIINERLIAEAELIDEICLENERSLQHMK